MIQHKCVVKPCLRMLPSSSLNPIPSLAFKNGIHFLINKTRVDLHHVTTLRNPFVVCANPEPGASLPLGPPPPPNSRSWIIALVVSFIVPLITNKWGGLWAVKNRIESVVQRVENVVETVEVVAGKVDKIAEEIIDDLPQGKLRSLVELVEDVAERTAEAADDIDNVIDKVQEIGDHMDVVVKQTKSSSNKAAEI